MVFPGYRQCSLAIVAALAGGLAGPPAGAADDAGRFTYALLYCTPDNESHFEDVTVGLAKENFAPPAAPIAIGGNQPASRT